MTTISPFLSVHGVGVFDDPNGVKWILVAAEGKVYKLREGNTATEIPVGAGATITGTVRFVQCMNVVVMFRGTDEAPLVMETLDEGFKSITQTNTTNTDFRYTDAIPNATDGCYAQNRLFILNGDTVVASDILDYTRYRLTNEFRINQGTSDAMVKVYKFNETTLVGFKDHSIYVVSNVYGDLSNARLDEVTREYGLAAAQSVVNVGKDLWFLAPKRGVCSLTKSAQDKLQGVDVPISHDIEPLIKRINWTEASIATAAYWNNRFYLAVPLDDARSIGNNILDQTGVAASTKSVRVLPNTRYLYTEGANEVRLNSNVELANVGLSPGYLTGYESIGVTPGNRYYYTKGANDTSLTNGTETLSATGEFTAQGTTVKANGTAGAVVTTSIKQIWVTSAELTTGLSVHELTLTGTQVAGTYTPTATLKPIYEGVNNAVIVFDFLNGKWSGYDTGTGLMVKEWVKYDYLGVERLFFISEDGFLNLYEEIMPGDHVGTYTVGDELSPGGTFPAGGSVDVVVTPGALYSVSVAFSETIRNGTDILTSANGDTKIVAQTSVLTISGSPSATVTSKISEISWEVLVEAVESEVLTRGYTASGVAGLSVDGPGGAMPGLGLERKRWKRLEVDFQTWNPSFSVSVVGEGANEETRLITNRTKDRVRYYRPWGKANFVETNANNDFNNPYREDYSVSLTGSETLNIGSGIDPDQHQSAKEKCRINDVKAKSLQVKVVNTQGRANLESVRIYGQMIDRSLGVKG